MQMTTDADTALGHMTAALGGDREAARRVVATLSPVERWVVTGGGEAEARAVLGSYIIRHGDPRASTVGS